MLIQTFGVAIQLYLHPSISTALMRPRRPNQYGAVIYLYMYLTELNLCKHDCSECLQVLS